MTVNSKKYPFQPHWSKILLPIWKIVFALRSRGNNILIYLTLLYLVSFVVLKPPVMWFMFPRYGDHCCIQLIYPAHTTMEICGNTQDLLWPCLFSTEVKSLSLIIGCCGEHEYGQLHNIMVMLWKDRIKVYNDYNMFHC